MIRPPWLCQNARSFGRLPDGVARLGFLILIFCLVAVSKSAAQVNTNNSDGRRTTIARAKLNITVDGFLNEDDWSRTDPIGEILQREPHPGEKATERSEVKILYDSANFYIGVMCYDSEPRRIVGTAL